MEAVKTAIESAQTKTFSQSQSTSTNQISREEHAALFAFINKARLLNGWTMRTAKELDQTIRAWHEALGFYQIPASAYGELYKRAIDVRQTKMQQGHDAPLIDAALLISQWTGPNGLRNELRQKEIDAGRTLGANAESVCQHCDGSGFRFIEGGVKKCDHA